MKKMIAVRFSLCLCFSVVLLFLKAALAQQSNFRNPLDLPIQLSANFGELRTDHYHTGWDIRTTLGQPVMASAAGRVVFAGTLPIRGSYVLIDSANPDVVPLILPPGRTMLPFRFIAEQLGAHVDWDPIGRVVTITYSA